MRFFRKSVQYVDGWEGGAEKLPDLHPPVMPISLWRFEKF